MTITSAVKRRDFLAAAGAAGVLTRAKGAKNTQNRVPNTLFSAEMTHQFGDLFNPPALTNFLGCAQTALDVTAVRSVSFPPFAQGEGSMTGALFLDGEYQVARKDPIHFVWRPDRIERWSESRGLRLRSTTIIPQRRNAVAVRLRVENAGKSRIKVEVKLAIQGGATKRVEPWNLSIPEETDNRAVIEVAKSAVVFESRHSAAASAQAAWPAPSEITASAFVYRLDLAPGETREIVFSDVIGERGEEVLGAAVAIAHDFDAEMRRSREEWDSVFNAAFTPGNSYFSGYLPRLVTSDPFIAELYQTALATLLFHRRTTPASAYGTTYVTLAPRYWETTTFLWDISLSWAMLALLDPAVLRRMVETWMTLDIHKHFGTEFLTGAGVGPWYSVNDYAMCRMARDYVRWTGDQAWLDENVGGVRVIDRLVDYATHWRTLDVNHHGLAD